MGLLNRLFNQVNIFDGGKTYSNPAPKTAPKPAAKPQPRVNAQKLQLALNQAGLRVAPRPPQQRSIVDRLSGTPGIGGFITADRSIIHSPENFAKLLAANATHNKTARANAANNLRPAVQTGQSIARFLPEAGMLLTHPNRQYTYTPGSRIEKGLFGSTPVQNVNKKAATTYTRVKAGKHPGLAIPAAAGETALSLAQDIPVLKGLSTVAKTGLKVGAGTALKAGAPLKVTAGEKVAIGQYARQMGSGAPIDQGLYDTAKNALNRNGINHSDPHAVRNAVIDMAAHDNKVAQRQQTVNNVTGKLNVGSLGMSTKKVNKPNVPEVPKTEYRSSHQITDSTPIHQAPIDNMVAQVKGKYGLTNFDQKDIAKLKKIAANPEADVKIYRASPANELNHGDWVTTDKTYANDIKRQNGGTVHEYTVKAKELHLPNNIEDNPSLARFSAFKYQKPLTQPTQGVKNLSAKTAKQDLKLQVQSQAKAGSLAKTPLTSSENLTPTGGGNRSLINNTKVMSTSKAADPVAKHVQDYADFLKSFDDTAKGGMMIPDGAGGYKRITEHSRFYRDYYAQHGTKPPKSAWLELAQNDLRNGKAESSFQEEFNRLQDRGLQDLMNKPPQPTPTPAEELAKQALDAGIPARPGTIGQLPAPKTVKLSPTQAKLRFKALNKQSVPYEVANPQKGGKTFTVSPKGVAQEGVKANSIKVNLRGSKDGIAIKVKQFAKPKFDFSKWKDYSALGLGRETLQRNLDRVAGADAGAVKKFLVETSRNNETARIEFANNLRQSTRNYIVKGLGIKAGSKESALVQKYGEGLIDQGQLIKEAGAKAPNILQAAEYFRNQYDALLNDWNAVRAKYGYDPVPKRQDYFRHFEEINKNANILGIIKNSRDLPTNISGITDMFRPSQPFSSAAIQRLGNKTKYDAVGGFDNYINSVSKQMFHTDTVQRGRAIDEAIRTAAEDNPQIQLPNFVANLSEWTNLVSGKKTRIDRAAEQVVGRKVYDAASYLKTKTGANMIGANLASAMTNFIPFTQALATTSKASAARALMDTAMSPLTKNPAVIDGVKSAFLTRRYPDEAISLNKTQTASKAASLPFRAIDSFTSRSVVAGKYYENLANGMSKKEAMKVADDYAGKVITDRSWGQLPNLIETKTAGFLTQFQAEVNNQVSFMLRDIPQFANGDKAKIASALGQFFLYSYLFNEGYQHVLGRRVQFDPIDFVATAANPNSNNRQRVNALQQDILGGLPFTSIFTNGRLPVNQMFPDTKSLISGIGDLRTDPNKAKREIYKGVSGPVFYGVPPFGGGQLKKTIEAANSFSKGYSETPSGKERFKLSANPADLTRGLLFGQYATGPGQQYIKSLNGSKKSGAGNQQGAGTTKEITTAALNTAKGKELINLPNEDARKAWAGQSQENYDIYKQYQAMKKGLGSSPAHPPGLSDSEKKILNQFSRLTTTGTNKVKQDNPGKYTEYQLAAVKQQLLNGAIDQATYDKKVAGLAKTKSTKVKAPKPKKVRVSSTRRRTSSRSSGLKLGKLPTPRIKLAKSKLKTYRVKPAKSAKFKLPKLASAGTKIKIKGL